MHHIVWSTYKSRKIRVAHTARISEGGDYVTHVVPIYQRAECYTKNLYLILLYRKMYFKDVKI